MRIRVLGAHNLETADTRHTCFLVNENLCDTKETGLTVAEGVPIIALFWVSV